jgi:hypothetical protein
MPFEAIILKELGKLTLYLRKKGDPFGCHKQEGCDCLLKTQENANSQEYVYFLTPAQH